MWNKRINRLKDMSLATGEKEKLYKKFGKSETDTGNAEAQIAVFSARIKDLTEHLKRNRKDFVTQKSLITMVGKRRGLLDFLKHNDILRYRAIVQELGLRK